MDLEEHRFRLKVSQRTLKKWVQLYFLRAVLNFVVLVLLGGSFYLIYFATDVSQNAVRNHSQTLSASSAAYSQ